MSLEKRPPRALSKVAKYSGALRAGSIGDLIAPTSNDPKKHYTHKVFSRHTHTWIFGDVCAVCTKCGKTIPKNEAI